MMRLFRLRDRNNANQKRVVVVEKQIVKACRYGDRTRFFFIVRADEKLTAFLELESVLQQIALTRWHHSRQTGRR